MKSKLLIGIIAATTIGGSVIAPVVSSDSTQSTVINKTLLTAPSTTSNNSTTNEAVVINGNSNMNLYALSNGSGIISNLSTGEMLTILGQSQKGYCKVKVQETGAVGYISTANMQNILNGTNDSLTALSESGQVVNVSSNVRLRSNPAISAGIIGHLSNGTSLNILGKQGQWYKVSVNGEIGFVYGEYIGTNLANSTNNSNSATTANQSNNTKTASKLSNNTITYTNNKTSNNSIGNSSGNSSNTTLNNGTNSGITTRTKGSSSSTKATTSSTSNNVGSTGYTYGTSSELKNLSGSYYLNNFTKGAVEDLSGVTINSNGVVLTNNITDSGNLYQSSARMKVYKVSSSNFTTIFGATPASLGLQGSSFNVYAIGNVFIYQLPNQNIVFSYEGIVGSAINTTNNIATSNVSKWYGNYTVGNKVGQLNGYNSYGVSSTNITGQKVVIQSNEFQFDGKTIKDPQYYILKVSVSSDLPGTSFSGADLSGANTVDVLAVLPQGYNMSNMLYNSLPSYTGCMSGAWAAGIAMPIILGPNGNIQVMNNNFDIYSASQGTQAASTSGSNQGTSTQGTANTSSSNTTSNSSFTAVTVDGTVPYGEQLGISQNPNDSSSIVSKISGGGIPIKVLNENDGWCKVEVNNTVGYMQLNSLNALINNYLMGLKANETPGAAWGNPVQSTQNVKVSTKTAIPLFLLPNTSTPVIENLSGSNISVEILGHNSQWSFVEVGGNYGYVETAALNSVIDNSATPSKTVTTSTAKTSSQTTGNKVESSSSNQGTTTNSKVETTTKTGGQVTAESSNTGTKVQSQSVEATTGDSTGTTTKTIVSRTKTSSTTTATTATSNTEQNSTK